MDSYEKLLLNLQIISKIKTNNKIYINNDIIYIEPYSNQIITPLKRWYYGDSREKSLNHINNIINITIEILNKQDNVLLDNKDKDKMKMLFFTLEKTIIGLNLFKINYINDIITVSKIDILISKIDNFIKNYDTFVFEKFSSFV